MPHMRDSPRGGMSRVACGFTWGVKRLWLQGSELLLWNGFVENSLQFERLQLVIGIKIKGDSRGYRLHCLRINVADGGDDRPLLALGQHRVSVVIEITQNIALR